MTAAVLLLPIATWVYEGRRWSDASLRDTVDFEGYHHSKIHSFCLISDVVVIPSSVVV